MLCGNQTVPNSNPIGIGIYLIFWITGTKFMFAPVCSILQFWLKWKSLCTNSLIKKRKGDTKGYSLCLIIYLNHTGWSKKKFMMWSRGKMFLKF